MFQLMILQDFNIPKLSSQIFDLWGTSKCFEILTLNIKFIIYQHRWTLILTLIIIDVVKRCRICVNFQ